MSMYQEYTAKIAELQHLAAETRKNESQVQKHKSPRS